jgi:predicted small lipoprotein YifL
MAYCMSISRIACALLALGVLAGCGQKGPLYLARQPSSQALPITTAAPNANADVPEVAVPTNPAMPRSLPPPSDRVLK